MHVYSLYLFFYFILMLDFLYSKRERDFINKNLTGTIWYQISTICLMINFLIRKGYYITNNKGKPPTRPPQQLEATVQIHMKMIAMTR